MDIWIGIAIVSNLIFGGKPKNKSLNTGIRYLYRTLLDTGVEKVEIVKKEDLFLEFDLIGYDTSVANAVRYALYRSIIGYKVIGCLSLSLSSLSGMN